MTQPAAADHTEPFDAEPLSWVLGEIRAALQLTGSALRDAAAIDPAQIRLEDDGMPLNPAAAERRRSALAHASAYLHQAHGALLTLGLLGVARITGDAEHLLAMLADGRVILEPALVERIALAFQALGEYLDDLVHGAPQQPVRLFPTYRLLLEAMGAERIHPADLFFPDLGATLDTPPAAPVNLSAEPALLRQQFERALLRFLQSGETSEAERMAAVLAQLAQTHAVPAGQRFWWALQGFALGVAQGRIRVDMLAKQLFGRINKQLRHADQPANDGVLRDALFFIARVDVPGEELARIRAAWRLDGLVPADYEQQRYGLVDQAALNMARERALHAKSLWNRIANGELAVMGTFKQDLEGLQAACAGLGSAPMAQLAAQLAESAVLVADSARSEDDCMEIATAILQVENALKEIRRLPAGFAEHAAQLAARLAAVGRGEAAPPPLPEAAIEENNRLSQLDAMRALAAQMQVGLQEAERILDEYFRLPSAPEVLANVLPLLHQIEGGLAILEQDPAVLGLQHTQIVLTRLAEGHLAPDDHIFAELAQNLGALGLFMDALRANPEDAKQHFVFDAGANLFRARQRPGVRPMAAEGETAAAEPSPAAALAATAPTQIEADLGTPADAAPSGEVKRIGAQHVGAMLYSIFRQEGGDLLALLAADLGSWRDEPERSVNMQAVHAAHSLSGSSAAVGLGAMQDLALALEAVLQQQLRQPVTFAAAEFDVLDAAVERLAAMLNDAEAGVLPAPDDMLVAALERLRGALDTHAAVSALQPSNAETEQSDQPSLFDSLAAVPVEEGTVPQALLVDAFLTSRFQTDVTALQDSPDPDLLPIFLEEARDVLPQVARALRDWRRHPEDEELPTRLLRLAHTLKGSARMAGAMRLGQHMHHLETRIENCRHVQPLSAQIFDELLQHHDRSVLLFEQLAGPREEAQPATADTATPFAGSTSAPAALVPASAPAPLVRVRADILDRLVNQAGEVAISRSRLETEVGSLRQSLGELAENLARLRGQLREVELTADAQVGAQTAELNAENAADFDPLELDRYTRLQELTRMMAESVEDVGAVQQILNASVAHASTDLAVQGRMTRDLQQDLMRVRMVQVGSLADRLYRVVRQTAKEAGRRVNLDIRGGALEVDRGVLDRMVGAFEHLLRNAIVHGIEDEAARRLAGKLETGDLTLEVRQDGNDVVLVFADDGGGLDYEGIRRRAVTAGLLAEDAIVTDADLRELVFVPGFSTALEITEYAGRGIGMDVVRSEAASLGGTVQLASTTGQGTRVTIRLPLTLAVTQVVLLSCGGQTFAVPSSLVEQVVQLKREAFTAAYRDGAVQWQGQRVPMVYLGRLLAQRQASPAGQAYAPIIILRQGTQRIAVHVDEIHGNREVVVKRTGAQVARLAGVSGATVLGSGQIVVIVDPLRLVGRELPPLPEDGVRAEIHQAHILVVDDSLTVRKVTQRLLMREGYQVSMAKDGVEALERLRHELPDLVLVDVEMPRMDGFALIRELRDEPRTAALPVIVVTSRTAAKHREAAAQLRVQGYFGKPYQEAVLLDAIATALGRLSP